MQAFGVRGDFSHDVTFGGDMRLRLMAFLGPLDRSPIEVSQPCIYIMPL